MREITLTQSPQGSQRPDSAPNDEQRVRSRAVMLSLLIFALSFGLLFAGPALALRLMAGPTGPSAPSEGSGNGLPQLYASAAVNDVILQQGKVPLINGLPVGSVYTGTADTYMNKWIPTTNYWSESRLVLGQSGAYRPLIRFDLGPASIPTNSTVISAELGIYCNARNLFQSMQAAVYQVIRPWNPEEVTWQRAAVGTPWTIEGCDHAGADRAATPSDSRVVFDRNVHQWFNVTSIVQNWVSTPASNKGFLLIAPDPAVIYYYRNSRFTDIELRPKLIITWTIGPPGPTPSPTPGPSPTPTRTPTPIPIPGPEVAIDQTSNCYTHTFGVWNTATGGGYNVTFEYENVNTVVTASWRPCVDSPLPLDSMYEVFAHWSVHSARPTAVPYKIMYHGGSTTIYVDQTKDASGDPVANFSPSGWYSLGIYPFRAGTYATTGEYVELSSPPDATVTCADAVRWVSLPGAAGPPASVAVSASPAELPSDGAATTTIVVTVTDSYGNMVADGTMVGLTTTGGTLPYAYVEAEHASVTKLGTWNVWDDASHSGAKAIYSSNFGDEVSWTFWGTAASMVYYTHNVSGGVADVTIDGNYVATISFSSAAPQFRVERQLASGLAAGPHTLRVRNSGTTYIWLDAFRSGVTTSGGTATATLTAPNTPGTAIVGATALGAGLTNPSVTWPYGQTQVAFPGPDEVWVDDDYCSVCANDGHLWNYNAFDTIGGGVAEVLSGGTVHVAAGTYPESITVAKPLSLLGAGSGVTVLDGVSDAPGSRGFYVDRADNVTITGFAITDFQTGIYLRGTGAGSGPRVYNATITQNAFQSNDAGPSSYAVRGSFVYTSTICSNDISLGYHGIYLDNTFGTTVCYNDIYQNKGFGIKIDTGDDNSIDNNTIHENQNLGIEISGTNSGNGVFGNVLHTLWWDGVLIRNAVDPQVVANTISNTNLVWLDASASPPDGNHNLGGVVLLGVTNGAVYDNRIWQVSNAQGHRLDAAGVYLSSNTPPILIETNLIRNCVGHGIHVPSGAGDTTIHGNSIFGNGRFGLNNVTGLNLQVQGNWWGRNTPTTGPAEPRDIRDRTIVTYSPPISLSLTAAPTSIPANGVATSTITARAWGYGYNILDGTWVNFTNTGTLGTLVFPTSGVFAAGQATTLLRAGTIAGTETITGTAEPGIEGRTVNVILTALGPHHITISADPTTVEVGGGSQGKSVVTAVVQDINHNGVPGIAVAFSSSALGGVSPFGSTTAAATGAATTTFTSGGFLGVATVTATAGVTLTASTHITITAGPPCTGTIKAAPSGIPANGIATSTITVALTDCVGYPVSNGTMVGFTTTRGSMVNYAYVEAESTEVISSTGWTVSAGAASGGQYIGTNSTGAALYWTFHGQAVALTYYRSPGGGQMAVRVDGGAPVNIDTNASPTGWVERVIATNLDSAVTHQLEVTRQAGTIYLDFFRSGAATVGGVATAILRAPVSAITDTATVYATSALGHPVVPPLVLTTTVVLSQTDVVWVDDNWAGLPNDTPVAVPGGTAYIGNMAFDTIPGGVLAVRPAGTVYVLPGNYPLPVNITKTLNLLGSGSADTFITGSGSGDGIRVRNAADGTTIEGFTIRSFGYCVYLDGRNTNNLDGVSFTSNVLTGCVTGAITATYVNDGYIADNALHHNPGFGFDLLRGDDNLIRNNQIYDNGQFGLGLWETARATISYNNLHDLQWDGIRVGGGCVDTDIFSNTVRATNLSNSPSGFNRGGIVLYSTTNSDVGYNLVTEVGTAGGSTNTAGVHVDGNDGGAMIHHNRILNNINDGVLLANFLPGQPPTIHCNHIYGNGRFGLRNAGPAVVNATDNWWGRNTPTVSSGPPADIYWPGVGNVIWDPRIQLTITAATTTVTVGTGPIVITATACGASCCLLEGTPVTFTTDLGGLGSPPGSAVLGTMSGGKATVMFTPLFTAGTATITATVLNAGQASITVTIQPGLPASIVVSANPTSIPVGNVVTSTIAALVLDLYDNEVADGTVIDFDTTLGWTLLPTNTTVSGVATTTLYSGVTPGIATVTAAWNYVLGFTTVEITAGPPCTITWMTADPPAILADGIDTSLIRAMAEDQYGNPVPDGTMVGFTTTAGSLIHEFVQAEDPLEVITSTDWTEVLDGSASGGKYIRTSVVGAEAYWEFRGGAVSLIYRRYVGGGQMRVRVDGGTPVDIDTNGTPAAWVERVFATNLNPAVVHVIRAACVSGQIRLDAFRSGAATSGGQAESVLTSALLPPQTAVVWATGIGCTFPTRTVEVDFLQPMEVWVDDDYCSTCFNDGHLWGFDAFDNMPDGVGAVHSGGTVHVLAGMYTQAVDFNKPIYLDGAGSATTFVTGPGSGNGIRVRSGADGTTIEGFTIRSFGYCVYLDGRNTNNLDGVSFTSSVLSGCVTGAITATYVNDGYIADNALHHNPGFGFDLLRGDDNLIRNNHIYDNGQFGLRIRETQRATISYNNLHDLQWDGIRLGGGCIDTDVFSNTVRATNLSYSSSGFNGGGVALYSTTNSNVAYNIVTNVDTAGGSTDTAGVFVDGNDGGAKIHHNRILNNVNDGILLADFLSGQPPTIHCNHIYGNGRFGLRNTRPAVVNATDNWWGRNTPTRGTTPPRDIYEPAVANVTWSPRIHLALSAPATVPWSGPAVTITATGCNASCCLLDGTPITFTTNLGGLGTPPGSTASGTIVNGQETVLFTPGIVVGTATITATVPNNGVVTTTITILAPPPPQQTILTADPTAIPADGSSTSKLTALVLDPGGNPVPHAVLVGFTTTMGSMLYNYVEDPQVNQSPPGSWVTEANALASGGTYIRTTLDGAAVFWTFKGNGVSIIYRQNPSGGIGDVSLDGNPLGSINMQGANTWRAEKVYNLGGSATASHVLRLAHRVATGPIYMDAFRSGVMTSGGQSIAFLTAPTITGTATVGATAISETLGIVPHLLPAFVNVRFEPADLIITKTVEPATQVSTGQRITFTLNYQNMGPITATGVSIVDTISNGALDTGWLRDVFFTTTPLTVTPHLHYYWSLGSIGPGASGSIAFGGVVEPNRYWPSETVLTNTVRIDSPTVDPRRGNNTRTITTTVVPGGVGSVALEVITPTIRVGGETSNLRATVRDAHGNPVANGTSVTFTTSLGGFGSPPAPQRVRTTTDGRATIVLTSGQVAGTAHVTATVDSLSATGQVIFTPLGPFTVTVTANPDHIKVNGSTSAIEALVVDQYGNGVANGTAVSFATSAGTVNPLTVNTTNGRAITVLTSGTQAVTAVVTATADSRSGTTTVVFEPGQPSVTITANPMILDVGEPSLITVMAKDQFGNNVANGTIVTFTTSLGYFTENLTTTITRPTTSGRASVQLTSHIPGTAVVWGRVGTETQVVRVTFQPGVPYSIDILAVDPALIQSCIGTALASAEVRDRFGNLVRDGTVVVFDVVPTGDVEPIDGGRTTNGIARAIISAGTTPTWATVFAWPEQYRSSISDQYGIEFQVGPPDHMDAAGEPPRLLVGGNRATIRVRVFDCGGYPVTDGTLVTFTLVSGQGSLTPQTTTTASGWAYGYLTSPNETGTAEVRVRSGEVEKLVIVEYIPGPPADVTISADPVSIAANGLATTNIDADVEDRFGNAVLDRTTVMFSTSLGRFPTGSSYSAATTGGKARAVLTSSTLPGMASVEAIATGVRADPVYVDFYAAPTPSGWLLRLPIIRKNSRP